MNFGALKQRASQLAQQAGWKDVQPAVDWGSVVNLALEEFSWEAEYQTTTATITLVAGTASYALPAGTTGADWKRVTDAVLNSSTSLRLTDENLLRRENPNWITAAQSTPTRYWMSMHNTIQFYPTPSSSGDVVTVRGPRADTPLVLDADSPGCPAHFHEAIALLAAWRVCKQFAAGEDRARVAAYKSEAAEIMKAMDLSQAEQESPAFQRRVRRSVPERVSFGWMRWIP